MLVLHKKMQNQPVLSLRTGAQVATATQAIVNPSSLRIEGFYCDDRLGDEEMILLTQDIREHIKRGFVVNDHEVLTHPDDLIRLKKVIDLAYEPIGKLVVCENGTKLGKLNDYAVDSDSLYIKKIYVAPRLLKSITGTQLSIDRDQIVETTDTKIVVRDSTVKIKSNNVSQAINNGMNGVATAS
jgi:uncharacterized protein YrrD